MRPRWSSPTPLAEQVAAVAARPYPVERALLHARALADGDLTHLGERTERDRLAPLRCLECAIASEDQVLMRLIAYAVIADWPGVHVFPDGKQMRRGSRVDEHRRDRWGRVWGHLQGFEVGILDPREATSDPVDRKVYVRAWVTEDDGEEDEPERRGFSVILAPGAARGKRHVVPRADRELVADVAVKLRGAATLKVAWGWIASTEPSWRRSIRVPRAARAVRAVVRGTIDEAEAAAIAALRRSGRRHVDNMAAAVAVYLLMRGHGALSRRGLRATVREYFGRVDETGRTYGGSSEQRIVRNCFAEAGMALRSWRAYYR
jgi:hypothetical protein